jgi:hypothetical protein
MYDSLLHVRYNIHDSILTYSKNTLSCPSKFRLVSLKQKYTHIDNIEFMPSLISVQVIRKLLWNKVNFLHLIWSHDALIHWKVISQAVVRFYVNSVWVLWIDSLKGESLLTFALLNQQRFVLGHLISLLKVAKLFYFLKNSNKEATGVLMVWHHSQALW